MRVLFDTNVVLDLLLGREPHAEVAAQLFTLVDTERLEGVLAATTFTTIECVATKAVGREEAKRQVRDILAMFDVAAVDGTVIGDALALDFEDFEDAVIHEAARHAGAVAIVTRDSTGFAHASLATFAPRELLAAVLAAE